jgi:hypothetical protein
MRDVLSGKKVGIGFSMGAERKMAYDMALFCAAIPKVLFCRLFGIKIRPNDWVSEGLPATRIIDRGPGTGKSGNNKDGSSYGEVEWAPAYSGQSKATIESSHPRTMKKEGQPTFLQSDKTPIELARQEIRRLIDYNMGTLVEPRLHPHPDMIDLPPSPIALWEFFEKRGRNDAIGISIDEAVRSYLSPVDVVFNRRCVCLEGVIDYGADELKKSSDFQRVKRAAHGNVTLKAWVLSFCLRYIWVEFNGKILMLEAQLKYLDNDELLDISLTDLSVWKERRAAAMSDFAEQQHAMRLETMQSYEEETGKKYDNAKRRIGRPKKNALSVIESREAREDFGRRRSA